jgi:hypothetical protein
MKIKEESKDLKVAPISTSLSPIFYPKKAFYKAWDVMKLQNTLIEKISKDVDFLTLHLKE